ncbi:YkyB family protein [Virgibacillus halodenitrificans]|uniref:YkyB-like protein n=1 Tax=Virgibacillus halodenitrificans TaxID=1482 RepID=A0AAC9NLB4_VIRHA|nr:YkyB family protein [Virgibacillus halodenitrificans]APC48790.1 hypothetical protein BME96_11580 [Virgibacillus halodenitrificans]MBD1224392.1 hypothetical protein [Virgibacillus halodenitrificans]MCG1029815.1 hypothetical protein [Virgibacillus halodenitrificans]MCJ0931372.1 hypothetical protein [Virgibacillus halodenitrificans]MEC2159076.1 YkyB family protein [Virgibacillus halodenitrificans]
MDKEHLYTLAKALYTINRHAKTAPQPKHLYEIKKQAINQLLKEKSAIKIGLHFSEHPKFSNQHSTLLVKVADYYFHIPPSKQDFEQLEHLGSLDSDFRNPQAKMPLSQAKKEIYQYIGWKRPPQKKDRRKQQHYSSYYTPSSLGKMEWPPTKPHRNF